MTKMEKSVEPKSRYLWIDILKGIGIVCVILGHTFIYGDRVYYFHMPLFFIVGGFLFRNGQEWLYLFWKSTKRIILPFIIYLIVLYLLTSYPPSKWCMLWGGEYLKGTFGVAWFCPVYYCSLLLLWFIPQNKYIRCLIVMLLYILCYIMPDYPRLHAQAIRVVPMALCYMIIGTLFRDCLIEKKITRIKVHNLFIVLSCIALLLSVPGLRIDMKYASYGIPVVSLFSSVILTAGIAYVSLFIEQQDNVISNIMAYFGRNTLSYMFVHQYVNIEIVSLLYERNQNSLENSILGFLSTLAITIFVTFIYDKIKHCIPTFGL